MQRADGLFGGLIVHRPAEKDTDATIFGYDKEQLLLVGDWYHWQGSHVLDWFLDPDHYGLEVRARPTGIMLTSSLRPTRCSSMGEGISSAPWLSRRVRSTATRVRCPSSRSSTVARGFEL